MDDNYNMQAVIAAARKGVEPVTIFSDPAVLKVLLPLGKNGEGQLLSIETEGYLPKPLRRRGVVELFDVGSFNAVLERNADAGDATIYVDRDPDNPAIVAVLNGNGEHGAGWGDFSAVLELRPTPQWVKWRDIDGKMLPQIEFAEFIEDNLADIADPPGAAMLEIATFLQATRNVDFKSGIRLSSGAVQLQNLESIDARVSAGQIEVPEKFTLGITPIQGAPLYSVPTRFRYRLVDGKLLLGIRLQRVEDLMRMVLNDVVRQITVPETTPILEGRAPLHTRIKA
jgi:uncharacterized protein YfdQ (DUF2303 family)